MWQSNGFFKNIKTSRLIHFFSLLMFLLLSVPAANAAGYSCTKTYTSCSSNYYLSGGQCLSCTSGCTCAGGTAQPVCAVTCSAGYYKNASNTCSACSTLGNGYYCPGGTFDRSSSATGYYSCTNKPSNSVYVGTSTSNSCPWSCNAGYYGSSANGNTSCADCGNGYYCTGGTHRASCSSTVPSQYASAVSGIYSLNDGNWSGYNNCPSASLCICDFWYSDSTSQYFYESSCPGGPSGNAYRNYYHCNTGYYAADPLNWGNWYTSCKACTNKPANSHYTSYSTPSTMYAVEDNCPWTCDEGYHNENGTCVSNTRWCRDTSIGVWEGYQYWNGSAWGACGPQSSSVGCDWHWYYDNGTCKYCPAGYWCYHSIYDCPEGYFCPEGMYDPTYYGTSYKCPDGYTSAAGSTAISQCTTSCSAGQRVVSAGAACSSPAGAWYSAAQSVNYGQVSTVNYCPTGFTSSSTSASGHDAASDCSISVGGGKYVASNKMSVRYIKVTTAGSTVNPYSHIVEIQAFAASDGTGTNLLSGKGGTGSDMAYGTDGSWYRENYAQGDMIWDLGSKQTVGSIKFALYTDGRTYHDVTISVSTDNSNWTTVLGPIDITTQNMSTANPEMLVVAPSTQNNCEAGTAKAARTRYLLSAADTCSACDTDEYSSAGASSCSSCTNKPSNSYYTGPGTSSACPWACNNGFNKTFEGLCALMCTAGVTTLRTGTGVIVPLYAEKLTTPAINIRTTGGQMCYANLAEGNGAGAINVKYNNITYHTVD